MHTSNAIILESEFLWPYMHASSNGNFLAFIFIPFKSNPFENDLFMDKPNEKFLEFLGLSYGHITKRERGVAFDCMGSTNTPC